jgi:hypothetical protein
MSTTKSDKSNGRNQTESQARKRESADKPEKTDDPQAPLGPMTASMLVEPAKLIGWLGASVGGLTVLVVLIGFLALSAHDAMLGIPRAIEDKTEYIVVGSLFFSRSLMLLLSSLLDNRQDWILLGVIAVVLVLFRIVGKMKIARHLIALLVVGFIGAETFVLTRLIAPLQFDNVLLLQAPKPDDSQILKWILCSNLAPLTSEYGFLALSVLALAVVLKQLDRRLQPQAMGKVWKKNARLWRRARVIAFGLIVICFILLPRAYGVLTISNDYPDVKLITHDSPGAAEEMFLLREDDKFLVTYDQAKRSISTRKRDSFERLDISGYKYALFCSQ